MPDTRQSPIFSKTYDLLLWLLNHTERFPKSERFRLARRIEDSAFRFQDLLVQAVRSRSPGVVLGEADMELDRLRLYIRLSQARHLTSPEQYHFAAERLTEIGRLLGGWLKSLPGSRNDRAVPL